MCKLRIKDVLTEHHRSPMRASQVCIMSLFYLFALQAEFEWR